MRIREELFNNKSGSIRIDVEYDVYHRHLNECIHGYHEMEGVLI